MMGTEDLGERRQINHTPTIALGAAAVLLLLVGALSYRDFVKSNLEKEYAEKERELMMRHGYVPYPAGQQPGYNQAPTGNPATSGGQFQGPGAVNPNSGNPNGAAAANVGFQQPNTPVPPKPASELTPDLIGSAASRGIETSLAEPQDPELESIRNSLAQVREQSRRTEEQYREITGDVNEKALASTEGVGDISTDLPEFLREAVSNPPGGNPSVNERIGRLREQVLRAPSLAQVTGYNNDWGIVTFNAGAAQNVKKNQRFAIRRGSEILGWIKVDEVQANQSIAVLVTKNAQSDTALKPDVGDDLIDFELF
jgi:hypothetical protein